MLSFLKRSLITKLLLLALAWSIIIPQLIIYPSGQTVLMMSNLILIIGLAYVFHRFQPQSKYQPVNLSDKGLSLLPANGSPGNNGDLPGDYQGRAAVQSCIENGLAVYDHTGKYCFVIVLGLDRWHQILDAFGYSVFDNLIDTLSNRMRSRIRGHDIIANIGYVEFAIVFSGVHIKNQLDNIQRQISKCFDEPFHLSNRYNITVTVSMGCVVVPSDDINPENIMGYAHSALTRAQMKGGGVEVYRPEFVQSSRELLDLHHRMCCSLEQGNFELYFQPIIEVSTGQVVGAEALLRWHEPELGLIPPDQFISIAEDSGFICKLGNWVIKEACRQLNEWRNTGYALPQIAVNVSAIQLKDPHFVQIVLGYLDLYKVKPGSLIIELTETRRLENPSQVDAVLERLREKGIQICLDDFGTAYATMDYLRSLKFDKIKIDKVFIDEVNEAHIPLLLRMMINLARELDVCVVAEGVERNYQLRQLLTLHCDLYQGYYASKPLPADDFMNWCLHRDDQWLRVGS